MSTPAFVRNPAVLKIVSILASVSLLSTAFPVPALASVQLFGGSSPSAVSLLTDEQHSALPAAISPDISSVLHDSEIVKLDAENSSISITETSAAQENQDEANKEVSETGGYSLLSAPEIEKSDIDTMLSAVDTAENLRTGSAISGNTNIESLSIKWITEDSWIDFDENMLSQRWSDDGDKNIRYEINFALSGERNYEPGEIQLTIPKNVVYKRDGTTPAGNLSLAVPATPDDRATFAYADLGQSYLIANTRRLSAATSAHFEFSIKDIIPHEINGNPNEYKTSPLSAHLSVIGENEIAVEKDSATLFACFDTRERVASAFDRHEKLSLSYPSSFPIELCPENASEYIYLSFYSYASPSGNQMFTSSFECSLGNVPAGTVILGTSVSGTVYRPDSDGKTRYSYANGQESYESSGRTFGYATTYVACPKSSVPDGGHYTFEHNVRCTLTSTDDRETTTATAIAQKQYSPIEFTAPTGHFAIKKYGGYRYNNALNKMKDREDVLAKFTVENIAFGAPWTWDDLNGNSKMEENELGYRSYSTESDDIQTQFDHQKIDMSSDEFEFAYLEFPSLAMFDYKKAEETTSGYIAINGNGSVGVKPGTIAGGEYGYLPKSGNLDIDIYVQLNGQGLWIFVGTAKWKNGSLDSVSAQNSASVMGHKLVLPPNTTDYRTVAQTRDAGYIYKVSPTIRLKANNENNASRVDNLFKNSDAPDTVVYNRAEIRAYEQSRPTTPLMYMEWGAQDYLEGASLFVRPEKKTTYKNDNSYRRVEMTNTLTVTEQSNLSTRSDYDEAVQKKYILQETSGTFYDLLPVGVEPDMDSIKLRSGDTILSKQLVRNWRGSRHSMMIVEAKLFPVVCFGSTVAGKSGYRDAPYMTYKSYMSWESIKEVGNNVENVFAFKSSNPELGTVKGYKGEPDDPTFGNNNTSASATANVVSLISGLSDDERKTPSTVYARSNISLSVDMYSVTSLSKDVSIDNTRWDTGIDEKNPQNAYENGTYTYRLHMENDAGSKSKNIVIYDKLESYIPNESDPDFEDERWHGKLVGIDTSAIEAIGASPVVYYSTNPNIVVDNDSDRTGNNLSNTANWSTTPPEDLSLVSAIAIDVRTSRNGQDFVLGDDAALSAYIYMQAPDLSSSDTDTKAKMFDTVLSEGESESGFSGGAHAYNNAVMLTTTMANDGTESEYKMVRKDYTKVGLIPFAIELSKEFDDDGNRDGIRPAQAIMHVTSNGKRININGSEDIILSESNNWKMSFDALKYSPDGKEIAYAVEEEPVSGYELSYYGTVDNGVLDLVARNYHEPLKWNTTFDKKWEENDNRHPKTITIGIYANGVRTDTITLRESDGWTFEQRLYKYENGKEITYTFEEDYIPGYVEPEVDTETADDVMSVRLTNSYHPYGELSIKKKTSGETEASKISIFKITPTIYRGDNGEPDSGVYEWESTSGEKGTFENGDVLDIKGGETITIKNIPSENTYDVIEENPLGWSIIASQSTGLSGNIKAGRAAKAEIHNQYESAGIGRIDVQKTLSNHDLFPRMFRFELLDSEMNIMFTGTNAGDGTVSMPTQKFTNEDDGKTFTYYLREIKQEREGYTYDETVWRVEMIPHDQGDGTIEVETRYYKNDNAEALDKAVFANEYKASGELALNGWKTLSGEDLKDNMFSFVLEDENGNEVSRGSNTANGEVLFDPIKYDESDIGKTYTYNAREIVPSIPEVIEPKYAFTPNMENDDKSTWYENDMEDRKTISFDGAVQLHVNIEYSTEANYDVVEIFSGSGEEALKTLSGSGSEEFTVDDSSVEFYFHSDSSVIGGFGYYAEITPIYELPVDYDDSRFTYTIEVVDNGNGTLSFNTNVDKNPVFKNSMKPGELTVYKFIDKNADRSVEHNFKIQFTGEDIPDGEWEFTKEESIGEKIAFAVYSEEDKGLRFYKRSKNDWPIEGQEYHGHIADKIYWNVEDIVAPASSDVEDVISAVPWHEHHLEIIDVVDTIIPRYSTSWWFADSIGDDTNECPPFSEISPNGIFTKYLCLDNLDTSEVTDMSYMFYGRRNWEADWSYDLYNWALAVNEPISVTGLNFNTSNVQNMEGMFKSAYLDCDSFDYDTRNVTNMNKVFQNYGASDSSKISLVLDWDTFNVTTMESMFCDASVENISINFNTYNVTNMQSMFDYGNSWRHRPLKTMNLGNINTSNVTNMSCMFYNCNSLSSLDLSRFNTSKVTDMNNMFYKCSSLSSLDLSSFNTGKVTSMWGMFSNCSSLSSLDLSGFNTSKVTDMNDMFSNCSSLSSLDLSGFDTSKVTSIGSMFYGCSSLSSLDLSRFNTSKVTSMWGMFRGCSSLSSLDLSSFDTSNVTSIGSMFSAPYKGTMSLVTIFVSDLWSTDKVTSSSEMFESCTSLMGGAGTKYNKSYTNATYARIDDPSNGKPGYFTYKAAPSTTRSTMSVDENITAPPLLDNTRTSSTSFPQALLPYGDPFETLNDNSEQSIIASSLSDSSNTNTIATAIDTVGEDIVPWTTFGTCEWMIDADGNMTIRPINGVSGELPSNTKTFNSEVFWPWHTYRSDIKTVKFQEEIQGGTNISGIFYEYSSLKNIDLNGFDTSNVMDMKHMFSGCSSLSSLDVSGFDTSNVTNMFAMFDRCSSLASLDLSSFDTSNIINMSYMFRGCYSLADLDINSFDTSNVTDMCAMFNSCYILSNLDVSGFDTSKVTDMSSMFSSCRSLPSLDISRFDTGNVTSMECMFYECYALTNLDLSDFDTNNVTSMFAMFYECSSLSSLDLSGFDTSNVTNMNDMFDGCSSLTNLNLNSFDTSNVTRMSGMFYGCASLTSLDLSNFDTSNVIYMSQMFEECSSLMNLDLSNFDTRNVTSIKNMFYNCYKLNCIKLSSYFIIQNSEQLSFPTPESQYTGKWISYDARQGGPYTPAELLIVFTEAGTDTSLYAGTWQWEKLILKYTISYNLNGASGSMSNTEHIIGQPVTLARPNAYYLGHVFKEWNTAPDGRGKSYPAETALNEDLASDGETLTLYAIWEKDDSPIAIKDNILSFTLHGNESITFPNIPAGVGYAVWEETTAGWICIESAGENGVIVPEEISEAFFTNEYYPDKTQATITGTKNLDGIPAGDFKFSISENGTELAQASSSVAGMFSHTFMYDAPGEHDYDISEIIEEDGNVIYDTRSFIAHVSVIDNGAGALSASVSYPQGKPAFENKTKPGAISISKRIINGENIPDDVVESTIFDAVVTLDYGQGNIETREVTLRADGAPTVIDNVPAGTVYSVEEVDIPSHYMFDAASSENITGVVSSGGTTNVKVSNKYSAWGEAVINVKKELIGGHLSGNDFSFVLRDESGNIVDTMTNDEDGNASLFVSASTNDENYTQSTKYFVSEDANTFPAKWDGVLDMDANIVPVTITWHDNGQGRLIADIDYGSSEDGNDVSEARFVNKLLTGLIELSKEVVGGTPATDNKVFSFSVTLTDENGEKVEPSAWWLKDDSTDDTSSNTGSANDDEAASNSNDGCGNNPDLYDNGIAYVRSGQTLVLEVPHNTAYSISEQAMPEGFELMSSIGAEGKASHGTDVKATFVNSYNPTGSFELNASKIANGFSLTGSDFAFEVCEIASEDNEDGALDEVIGRPITATNTANGKVTFEKISIDRDDVGKEKTYRISEVKGNVSGIAYDTGTWIASVSFTDDGSGNLLADVSYFRENDETLSEDFPVFVNTKGIGLPFSGSIGILGLTGIGLVLVGIGIRAMYQEAGSARRLGRENMVTNSQWKSAMESCLRKNRCS